MKKTPPPPLPPTQVDRIMSEARELMTIASELHRAGQHRLAVRLLHQAGSRLSGIVVP